MGNFKIKARKVDDFDAETEKRKKAAERRKKDAEKGPRFSKRIPHQDDGELVARFLTNQNEWLEFQQYWDTAKNRPVLALEENEEEYKDRNIWAKTLYLAPYLDVESGYVNVLEFSRPIAERIVDLAKRKGGGDATKIDVELYKTGTGIDTKYFADYYDNADLDLSEHKVPDLWAILNRKAAEALGLDPDDLDNIEDEEVIPEDEPPFEADPPKRRTIRRK